MNRKTLNIRLSTKNHGLPKSSFIAGTVIRKQMSSLLPRYKISVTVAFCKYFMKTSIFIKIPALYLFISACAEFSCSWCINAALHSCICVLSPIFSQRPISYPLSEDVYHHRISALYFQRRHHKSLFYPYIWISAALYWARERWYQNGLGIAWIKLSWCGGKTK